jgi:hypothetical protein
MSKEKKTLKIQKDDYVIAHLIDKDFCVKIHEIKKNSIDGQIATVARDKVELVSFFPEDIIANLGPNPKNGTAYGVKVEIFYRYLETNFGKVALFTDIEKSERKELSKHYNKAFAKLVDIGLDEFTYTLDLEIRGKSGKMAGCYGVAKNLDNFDKLTIFIEAEIGDLTIEDVLYHESGHGVWNRLLQQDKYKARWVEDYCRFIESESINSKELSKHLSNLISSGETYTKYISSVKREGDDYDKELIKCLSTYFKQVRRLMPKDLDYLALYDRDFLKSVWPLKSQEFTKIKGNPISDYAMKNAQEYFCECFRIHMAGKKLPKTTRKLMEKTIGSCARHKKSK